MRCGDVTGGNCAPAWRVNRKSDDRRQGKTVSGADQQHSVEELQLQRDT